jgi:hypothetical protein
MFSGTNLRSITLGQNFRFVGDAGLPPIPETAGFTGRWQSVGIGTPENPLGEFIFTSAQLMARFDGATMEGRFVWQRVTAPPPPTAPSVTQPPPSEVGRGPVPKTGDSLPIGSIIYMWLVSLAALILTIFIWREKRIMYRR